MYLTVAREKDASRGLINIGVEDVITIQPGKNHVYVHTIDDIFYAPGTLRYYFEGLSSTGYHFKMVDRDNLVQITKIKRLDTRYYLGYFEDVVRKDSKRCTMTQSAYKEVVEFLRSINHPVVTV
jgi:hypothetical protein